MATPTVYVICDQNCKFEGMTKEQILAAIAQAVSTGEIKDVDAGFVTTLKTINGKPLKFFVGEQSEYDALTEEQKKNLFALITNDTTKEGLFAAIEDLLNWKRNLEDPNGTSVVAKAMQADKANTATSANTAQVASVANALSRPWYEGGLDFDHTNFKLDGTGLYVFWVYVGHVSSGVISYHTIMMYYNESAKNEGVSQYAGAVGGYYTISLGFRSDGTVYTDAKTTDGISCESYIRGYTKIF